MEDQVEQLSKMVAEIMQANIKLTDEVNALTGRLSTTEKALGKLIVEFERHSHNNLGIAVIPVS